MTTPPPDDSAPDPEGVPEPDGERDEQAEPERPGSGLRNPEAAVRGVGAGTLVIEALVLLLAIVPLTKLDTRSTFWAVVSVVGLCLLCILLCGMLRYRWAWYAAAAVQVLACLTGVFHIMLLIFGIVFAGIWGYVLYVRRSVLGLI